MVPKEVWASGDGGPNFLDAPQSCATYDDAPYRLGLVIDATSDPREAVNSLVESRRISEWQEMLEFWLHHLDSEPGQANDNLLPLCQKLRFWINKLNREGGPTKQQKTFCEILLEHGGEISPADMKIMGDFVWDNPREGAKQMVMRINKALGRDHQPIQVIASDRSNIVVAWKNTDAKKI